jgi:signal peptidase I
MDSSETQKSEPTPAAAGAAAIAAPAKKPESWWETIRFFLILFLAALIIRTFIVAPFSIPSGSMLPRLLIGDYLFVAKWPYGFSRYSMPFGIGGFSGRFFGSLPDRGDVVVFRHPVQGADYIVKRVIGLPGDTIQMRGGVLHLNGQPLQRTRIADFLMPLSDNSPCRWVGQETQQRQVQQNGETFCAYPQYRETLPGGRSYMVLDQGYTFGDDTPAIVVPEGHLFMMGDNRDDSQDSRFPHSERGVGFLPMENVVGRVMITFFSTDGSSSWIKPWTWFSAARWNRIGQTG